METETMRTKRHIRVGTRIVNQLSKTFYNKTTVVFSELASNSWDAGATQVNITVSNDKIIFDDNGQGMDDKQLERLFYISYTEKDKTPVIRRGGITRKMIGAFGVGYLSTYLLCRKIQIETHKDGYVSRAEFDFGKLEEKTFVDEFLMDVTSEPAKTKKTGTKVTLLDLKQQMKISGSDGIWYELSKNMPLRPDFVVTINGKKVEPMKLAGRKYTIDPDKDPRPPASLGKVSGTIIFTEKNIPEDSGVYVRVFGRVVNSTNPKIVELAKLTHAKTYDRRTYVDVNVDALSDAVLTNRAGFVEDDPKYREFKAWILRLIRKKAVEDMKIRSLDRAKKSEELEEDIIPPQIAGIIADSISKTENKITPHISRKISEPKQDERHVAKRNDENDIKDEDSLDFFYIANRKFRIKLSPLKTTDPECIFDRKKNTFTINTQHPLYLEARRLGCPDFHSLKAAMVALAVELSTSLDDFKKIYSELTTTGLRK